MPAGAHGGLVRVVSAAGRRSLRSRMRLVIRPTGARDPGGPVVEAKVQTRKLLFEGGRTATVAFYVRGVAPVDVAVDVVRASDRVAVAHFAVPATAPGSVHSVDWDGTVAGVAQPDGRYVFQVAAAIAGGAGARAAQAGAPAPRARELLARPRRLPDRRAAHLRRRLRRPAQRPRARGPGRHGRLRHCRCVAARAGTVKFAGSQALAGNYVVITAADGTADYVYMHLRDPALVRRATRSPPASRSASSGAPATPPPATCTSSCGRRPAGTRAGARSTRCRA